MPEGLVKDDTQEASASAPEIAAKPSAGASSAQSLSAQYDLGDTSLEVLEPTAQAAPAPQEPAKAVRDEKGRFLPKPKTFEHSASLKRRAAELGMSEEEIGGLSSDDLKDEITDRRWKQLVERATPRDSAAEPRSAGSPPEGQGRPGEQDARPEEIDLTALEEGGFDPALVTTFKSLAAQNKSLRDRLAQVEQYAVGQQQQSMAARADKVFAKYEDVFGKGRGHELDPNSEEMYRRKVILREVDADKGAGTLEAKIEKAYQRIYGKAPPKSEPESKNGHESKEEWAARVGLARPTHRGNGHEPKGEKKAVATLASGMRKLGYFDDGDDPKFID